MADIAVEALQALSEVDFEWAVHLRSVWTDIGYDIPSIHGDERAVIFSRINTLMRSLDARSPLGLVIRGNAGAGKTHLLSAIRQHVLSRAQIFILVDMTDVREFWETVNQGFLSSLEQVTPTGHTQLALALRGLLRCVNVPFTLNQLSDCSHPSWLSNLSALFRGLSHLDKASTRKFSDVLRASLLLGSDEFEVSAMAYNWLLGIPLEETDFRRFGFSRPCSTSMEAVEGISWLIGLSHCTVLALDQLDSIVTQHSLVSSMENPSSDEQKLSTSIVEGIAGGFSALRDKTFRTLSIVTCIEKTWDQIASVTQSSYKDRFESSSIFLANVYDSDSTSGMVANRLRAAYQNYGIEPPYSSWPFSAEFFRGAKGMLPRELLKQCDRHRQKCLENGRITELVSPERALPSAHPYHPFDQDYAELFPACISPDINDESQEDSDVASLLQFAINCLALELHDDDIDYEVDTQFTGGSRTRPLHARIRQILHSKGGLERHLSLRVLLRSNARAYNNRMQLAMGAAGIGRGLNHRQLLIFRNFPPPAGPSSQNLTQQFHAAGGEFLSIPVEDLSRLEALRRLNESNPVDFDLWQSQRRPVSQLAFLRTAVAWLTNHGEQPSLSSPQSQGLDTTNVPHPEGWTTGRANQLPIPSPGSAWPSGKPSSASLGPYGEATWHSASTAPVPAGIDVVEVGVAHEAGARIPVGVRLIGNLDGPSTFLDLGDLGRHTVILAGSGSGKTVLIRRLVEEAALQGIPSIVIDGANDLARLGDRWDRLPAAWGSGDEQKAEAYHSKSDVVLWTPGRESGNPLQLSPLPNFAAIEDLEELDQATDMARDALQDVAAQGNSQAALLKRGILKAALNHFASLVPGGDLGDFIGFLRDLPPEACDGIATANKRAQEMAGVLWAEVQNNPLLRQSGHILDPAILLGTESSCSKTRVSVINLCGLQGLSAQRQFLNQLFMSLFVWIKKNPPPPQIPLRGLLVLDEAKDFVPSRESTACKSSFNRLVAQARKYGLGIVVATQAPKSIDHNVIANCTTQFFGKANSPAAIAVVGEAVSQRGGNPDEVSRLKTGQFYISSEGINPPAKIRTPLCLSFHPPSPLSEEEVIQRAAVSRHAMAASSS
ncbi:helicase HerA domain-containing protein [Cyanobium sp. Lug-B]|uniref:helicase HerA domain-containing protein n=1 Tax=Cyanobium sp. Lug-B TaxID=2823716 RepID=UPI0020CF69E4|nr:DUF87 domain-containing protein [Cyanobium sp. Lug-B]MCP9797432.1 DUF87 domain-containing protein [Cyanobium sp. Lug-B]